MYQHPIVTADEAIVQGLAPSALFSVAKFNRENHAVARQARQVAVEMAALLGMDLGGRRKRASNDNRRQKRRRAA